MTDKEKLEKVRDEIERRVSKNKRNKVFEKVPEKRLQLIIEGQLLGELKHFINSMQEEPVSEDLETEIEKIRKYHFINDDFDKTELDGRTISNIARHFANWQKRQMIKEVITGQLENGEDYLRIKCLYTSCRPQDDGKLIRLIIINED